MAGIQFGGFAEGGSGGCGCCEDQCSCEITICVKDCFGSPLYGALVVLKKDGETIAICTTKPTGLVLPFPACCKLGFETTCPRNPTATYELTVSKEGYHTYKKNRSLTCDNNYDVVLLSKTYFAPVTFYVVGCCNRSLPGATVTFDDTEYTTDESGTVVIGVTEPGTYEWTVSKDRFVSQSGTVTLNPCFDDGRRIFVYLEPASGYHCGFGLADPLPETLSLTDSVLGGTALVWGFNALQHLFGWSGALTVHTPAQDVPGFPGVHCPPATGHVDYFVAGCIVNVALFYKFMTYVDCRCVTCVDGFKFTNFGVAVSERIFPSPPCDPITGTHSMMGPLCIETTASVRICPEDITVIDPTIPLNFNSTWCGTNAHGGTPFRLPWPVNFFTVTITE